MSRIILLDREDLEGLPQPVAPEGMSLRTYRPGDASNWVRIISEAFPEFEWDEQKFEARFLRQPQFSPEILFFVTQGVEGLPVGTAMAWVEDRKILDSGCVHWVAVSPKCHRRGIGRYLTLTVLWRFKEQGLPKAHLWTEDYRAGAIQMYEGLGFRKAK